MFDQISKSIDEFGNGILSALNDLQGVFGKELSVANPIKNSILDLVGNTPIIRLNQIGAHIPGVQFYLKAEFQNPTGSIRDRSAIAMIRDAEKRGKLKPGSTILISGNNSSSVSFSWAGRTMGYRVECFLSDTLGEEQAQKLIHFGADITYAPANDLEKSIQSKLTESDLYWYPNESKNMANPNHHYSATGPEILRDMQGKVDFFITGGGTGATVTGIGRFFRSVRPALSTKILLGGFRDSLFDRYFSGKNQSGSLPEIFDPSVVDQFISVTREEAVRFQSDLLIREGLPVGITTGMIVCAAIRYAESLREGKPFANPDTSQDSDSEKLHFVILSPDRE
jgi:cysteine synthase A